MIRRYDDADLAHVLDVWYLASLVAHARSSRPFLELDVFEANHIGRGFYASYGFRLVDRHDNENAGQPELRLRLD